MLNLTDIAQRISQPHLCSSTDAEDLRLLCEKYAYSQVFPLLYLSVLAHSNDVHFDQELTKHAYKISDRTRLYELIFEKDKGQETIDNRQETRDKRQETRDKGQVTEEVFGDEEIVELLDLEGIEKKEEGIEDERLETKDERLETKDERLETKEVFGDEEILDLLYLEGKEGDILETTDSEGSGQVIALETEEVFGDEEIVELLDEEEKEKKEDGVQTIIEPPTAKENSFEDEITAQTIAASYSLELEEKKFKAEDDGKETLDKGIEYPVIQNPASKIQDPLSETMPSSFKNPVALESKKSFSSWLHANENYTETKEEKVEINDLISKFIEDSPKISQPNEKLFEGRKEKKEFFSPTKKAKESLSEHQLPVSETLAKIFAAQGNFPKAIFAYEQLMLIIPEKKIFFANQIKELQKKLNQ